MFTWMKTYRAIADELSKRRDDQTEVLELFKDMTGGIERDSVDPFTFFTAFNRGVVIIDRFTMIKKIVDTLEIDIQLPTDFLGIPTANHELWQYFEAEGQGYQDTWDLFDCALKFAEDDSDENALAFGEAFDRVHAQENITKANLTRALYWVRPESFLPLGGKTREFLHSRDGLNIQYSLTGIQYLRVLSEASAVVDMPFYEIAAKAFRTAHADSWWPLDSDYNPFLMEEQWIALIGDPDTTSEDAMLALERIYRIGGEATPEELADEYGKDGEFYRTNLQDFSKAVCSRLGQKGYKGSTWPVAFVGQAADEHRRGDYVFKLRPELERALKLKFG